MKISIIGANGFLSSSIGQFCNKNNIKLDMFGRTVPKAHQFDNFYEINLLEEEFPCDKLKDSDIIVYAAGAGIQSNLKENASLIYSLNVDAPIRISNKLNNLEYKGVFVSFGSYFEIGENIENKFFSEKEVVQSQNKVLNDYSVSKRVFSRFITSVEVSFKYWHFILPTIYGENEAQHRLIPYTINALKNDRTIEFTSGEQVRQYIYIDEIAEILHKAFITNLKSGVYNIEGTETLTVKELVKKIFTSFNKKIPDTVFGKAERTDSGMKVLQLDGTKLYKAINYKSQIKIADVYDRY